DFPLSRGIGNRRGMGRWSVAVGGNVAASMASVDRGRAPKRGEYRCPFCGAGELHFGEGGAEIHLPRGRFASVVGVLDPSRCARDGRMACSESFGEAP